MTPHRLRTPTNLTATAVSSSQINLSWTASTDNVGVTGYQIYRGGTLLTTVAGTSYSNTGLTPSTSYSYYVRATDAAGNVSGNSNTASATTQAGTPVPTVTISANPTSVSSGGSSTLTWSSTNATSCTASGGWSGSKATSGSQSITNITSTATYTLTCTGTGGSGSNSATVTVTGGGGTNPPAPVTPGNQWQLKFFEEFDATDYDHTKLTPCFDWGFGGCTSTFNNGYEHYLPSQVVVGSGIARLIAAPLSPPYADSACYNGSCIYKSGLLATSRTSSGGQYLYQFTYGYVEARLKVPNTQGFFTAWWMLPANTSYTYPYEIDILEALGHDPTDMEMHYSYNNRSSSYTPNYTSGKNGACADLDYSQGYHNFGVDWEPTFIAFYIDGVKCGQFKGSVGNGSISNVPMQLILNHMVSVDWQRSVGKPLLDTSLTRELDVDYIHVWQQVPSSGDTTPPSTPAGLTATAVSSSQINLAWTASHRQRRRHRLPDIPRRHLAHHRHWHELQQHRPLALDFIQLLRPCCGCRGQLLRQLQHRERHHAGGKSCADSHSLCQPDINNIRAIINPHMVVTRMPRAALAPTSPQVAPPAAPPSLRPSPPPTR